MLITAAAICCLAFCGWIFLGDVESELRSQAAIESHELSHPDGDF